LTSINRGDTGHGSLSVMTTRSRRLRFAVALVAAMLFAAAPAVRAYCCVALPAAFAVAAQAEVHAWPASDEDGSGQDHPCCCDAPPASAAVDERASPKDGAAFAGKAQVPAPVLAAGGIVGHATPAPRLLEYRAPPPEPALRRFPRRLL
jgi:hypothetical protein